MSGPRRVLRRRVAAPVMTQFPLFAGERPEPVAELPRCAWRGCIEPATWSLGYGRIRDELLFADYCDTHATAVDRLFRIEARTHALSPDLAPAYARAREALEAESAFVQGALVE